MLRDIFSARSARGSAESRRFTRMYRQHYSAICAYFARRCAFEYVEELADDTFSRAWKNLAQLDHPDQPLPWLYGIAHFVLCEHYRRQSALPTMQSLYEHSADGELELGGIHGLLAHPGELATDLANTQLDILHALSRLSPSDREVLTLLAWEELTPAEIATTLNTPVNTIRVRIHRARNRLAKELDWTQPRKDHHEH